ncbi:MAG: hypothetical protein ABSA39_15030 [Edaphobacter sp.]
MEVEHARSTGARTRLVALPILLALLTAPSLLGQKGGSGGKGGGSSSKESDEDDTGVAVCPQIAGQHPLLEELSRELHLTCAQEVRILPLMHDEEAVSKPLLAYAAFTAEERQAMLLKVELAARAKVGPFLLPDQQKKNNEEAASLASKAPKKMGKKMPPASADGFASEEALSGALDSYSALTMAQKKDMILAVKLAARRDGAPALSAEQATKIDADIAFLRQ